MKRIIYTVLACAAFLAMLTGTSKKKKPREAGSIPTLTIPATTGWARNEVAGIAFLSPANSMVMRAERLDGIVIRLASGYDVTFEPKPLVIDGPKHEFHMYYAPDARIVLNESAYEDSCQVNACSGVPVLGAPLCVSATPKTNEECTQIVALVRSIQPL